MLCEYKRLYAYWYSNKINMTKLRLMGIFDANFRNVAIKRVGQSLRRLENS